MRDDPDEHESDPGDFPADIDPAELEAVSDELERIYHEPTRRDALLDHARAAVDHPSVYHYDP